MRSIGGPPLDQPDPIDVGDIIATHRLPWSASDLGRFLGRLADEWVGYQLQARVGSNGIEVLVESISDDGMA